MKRGALLAAALVCALLPQRGAALETELETVWLSAPILPSTKVLYPALTNYPSGQAEREQLARDASLTYDFLLSACGSEYAITRWQEGAPPLTPAQLYENYEEVARCSYEKFVAKPYWGSSRIIEDVDVCEVVLGPPWRMPTAADIQSLSQADFERLEKLLTVAPTDEQDIFDGSSWGEFYFSLRVFVRMPNGSVDIADLHASVDGPRIGVAPLPTDNTALRCLFRARSG